MEPIEPFAGSSLFPARRERRRVGRKTAQRVGFRAALDRAGEGSTASTAGTSTQGDADQSLEALLDAVHQVGERLKERTSFSLVQEYKLAVRDFLSYIVRNTLALERHESSPSVAKRKRFTLIRVIDQKLERLAAGIILDQEAQLDILRRIDEISGLLVDLLS